MSKNLILLFACLLLWVAPVQAQVTLVSGQIATDLTTPFETDGTGVVTFAAPVTVGNTITVVTSVNQVRTFTVADDGSGGSNTYACTTISPTQAGAGVSQICYAVVERAAQTVTVTASSATSAVGYVAALEFNGLDNTDLLEAEAQDVVAVAAMSHPTGPVTTTVNDSLLFAVLKGGNGTYDGTPTGFTEIYNDVEGVASYKILTATTAAESWVPTSAGNENSTSSIAAFNGTGAAPGGGCTGALALLGAGKCD